MCTPVAGVHVHADHRTAARSGEVLGARWDEFDLDRAMWTVPPARMKAGREHRVPLSQPALTILKVMHGNRNRLCRPKARHTAVGDGARNGAPSHEDRKRYRAWLSLCLPGLGSGVHQFFERGMRGSTCPRDREQGRGGVPTRRPIRQTPPANGSLGGLLRGAEIRQDCCIQEVGHDGLRHVEVDLDLLTERSRGLDARPPMFRGRKSPACRLARSLVDEALEANAIISWWVNFFEQARRCTIFQLAVTSLIERNAVPRFFR
jgi:hypothetical protein